MSAEVTREFDAGAARYDLLVGLNPGYHQHLRRAIGQRQNQQKMSQQRQGQRAAHATSGRWGELVAFGGGGVHGKALT